MAIIALSDEDWAMLDATREKYREEVRLNPDATVFSKPLTEHQCRLASRLLNRDGWNTMAFRVSPGTRTIPARWVVLFGRWPL